MGGSCSICHQPPKYNPIVESKQNRELEENSLKKPKPPENLFSNTTNVTGGASIDNFKGTTVKPNNVEPRLSNFSESDYTHYLKLQKALLLKNIINVKKSMFNDLAYEGELDEHQKKHGKGMLLWPDGTIYLGEWIHNKATGKGILSFSDSEHYEGMFLDNMFDGEGNYIDSKGRRFEGCWSMNLPDGEGTETHTEGHKFEGNYRFGKKNGQGKIYFSDGSYFTGEFRDDEIDGYGVYIWPKGQRSIYKGNWKNNKMNGIGLMIWHDSGKMYYGHYLNNKKNGLGIFYWGLNKKWVGYWKDGLRDGPGVLFLPENNPERGIWDRGKQIEMPEQENEDIFKEIEEFYEKAHNEFGSFEK